MKRKTWLVFVVILILLARCSQKPLPNQSSVNSEPIIWETSSILSTKDWHECTALTCLQHYTLVMDGLVRVLFKNGDWQVSNSLAEKIEWKQNDLWIEIKKGVFWSDGKELVAEDFLETWRNKLKQCAVLKRFSPLKSILGAGTYCAKKGKSLGLESPAPRTLVLHTSGQSSALVRLFAHPDFFPRPNGRKPGLVTLGPYHLKQDPVGAQAVYLPNPNFHRKPTPSRSLVIRQRTRLSDSAIAFRANQVQLAGPFRGDSPPPIEDAGGRLSLPTSNRLAAARWSVGSTASAKSIFLDWDEPARLSFPGYLSCRDNRLCAGIDVEKRSSPWLAPLTISYATTAMELPLLAQNFAAQWQAKVDPRVLMAPTPKSLPQSYTALTIFPYRFDPLEIGSASEALVAGCLQQIPAETLKAKNTKPVNSEAAARELEYTLIRGDLCVPLMIPTQVFLKTPSLTGAEWTALGVWDLSGAQWHNTRQSAK